MSKFVEVNTDYIDENGVQHIDGYTSNSDDAEGQVVAYFIKGEAYYTNPNFRFDELIKATIDGLKLEYEKTAQNDLELNYNYQDLDENNVIDLQKWVDEEELFGLVDENQGGIIGYINHVHIDRVCGELNELGILKQAEKKLAQSKYKDVVEPMKILQINDNAISNYTLNRMLVGVAFKDADSDINENIYYGSVFQTILENHANKVLVIDKKYLSELNDLNELCKEYQYVMVTKI